MSDQEHRSPAPNYTDAALCSFGVLLFIGLCIVKGITGYVGVFAFAWLLDKMIDHFWA